MTEKILFYGLISAVVGIALNWANSKANVKLDPGLWGLTPINQEAVAVTAGNRNL